MMEMAVRSMETAETAMETDGDGFGALPRPGRVPEQRFLSPKFIVGGGGAAELFWEKRRFSQGFLSRGFL
jgi:hypothetical protein